MFIKEAEAIRFRWNLYGLQMQIKKKFLKKTTVKFFFAKKRCVMLINNIGCLNKKRSA